VDTSSERAAGAECAEFSVLDFAVRRHRNVWDLLGNEAMQICTWTVMRAYTWTAMRAHT